MDSFGKALGTFFEERLSNPLVSSFVIAWSLYNYKIFVILFSKNTVTETFSLIHQRFPDSSAVVVHGVLLPAVFAALYLFALPFPTKWVYKWVRERQKAIDDIRDEYESHKRLTKQESTELRRFVREQEATVEDLRKTNIQLQDELKESQKAAQSSQHELQLVRIDAKNLKEQLETLQLVALPRKMKDAEKDFNSDSRAADTEIEEETSPHTYTADSLRELQMNILEVVGGADWVTPKQLRDIGLADKIRIDYALHDLVDTGDLASTGTADGLVYEITQKGRGKLLGWRK